MTTDRARSAITLLRWVVGLVILGESARFVFSPSASAAFAKTGLPNFVHLGVGWAEMVAAVMFLIPQLAVAGGRLLIVILGFAIVLHVLHGWFDVGGLVVYAAATWAVMAATGERGRSGSAKEQGQ